MTLTEWWLPVPGWEDLYLVSSWGGVWSIRSNRRLSTGPHPNGNGYPHFSFKRPGHSLTGQVHHIELTAFAGPCPPGMEGRHLNGVKTDLRWPENLVWDTHHQNILDKIQHGTMARGERHGRSKLTENVVLAIYARRHEPGVVLAAEFGVSKQQISRIINGHKWGWLTTPERS